MSNIPDNRTVYILEQNNERPLKVYKTDGTAFRVMNSRPSYHYWPRFANQGGILWKVTEGEQWEQLINMPGEYHPVQDRTSPESKTLNWLESQFGGGLESDQVTDMVTRLKAIHWSLFKDCLDDGWRIDYEAVTQDWLPGKTIIRPKVVKTV